MSATHEIFLRDRSSGRIHAAARRGDRVLTDEADNLDAAGDRDEVDADVVANAEPGDLCERCFPKPSTEP